MLDFNIGNKRITRSGACYIIAEIGGNFISADEGMELLHAAHRSGVDAVKLQTFRAETLASRNARYEMKNTGNVSQFDLFRQYEIGQEIHEQLFHEAKRLGIDIFSTPSHVSDVEMLEKLGAVAYKIGGDDTSNLDFIYQVASLRKPILLSTGTCTQFEVDDIVNTILKAGNSNFCMMHAVTCYPTPYELANLNAISTFLKRYPDIVIGYSDHTIGPVCSIAAKAMGAQVIERHFTLDKNLPGPDHQLSSDEAEMTFIVNSIRTLERSMGSGVKMPMGQELINRKNNRKSLVLERDLQKGMVLTEKDISVKRPGHGISPTLRANLIGKKINKDLRQDHVFEWGDFE